MLLLISNQLHYFILEIHRTEKPVILVEEARLSQCIEDIHKVTVDVAIYLPCTVDLTKL